MKNLEESLSKDYEACLAKNLKEVTAQLTETQQQLAKSKNRIAELAEKNSQLTAQVNMRMRDSGLVSALQFDCQQLEKKVEDMCLCILTLCPLHFPLPPPGRSINRTVSSFWGGPTLRESTETSCVVASRPWRLRMQS